MRKRKCLVLLVALMISLLCSAQAAGSLLPKAEEIFGTIMPSFSGATLREAEERKTLEDGSTQVIFGGVSDTEFDAWGEYLEKAGCSLICYETQGDLFTAVLEKDGHEFSFSYDQKGCIFTADYPKGTREEKLDLEALKAAYEAELERLQKLRTVGVTVSYGNYEQDNNPDNGKEEIEWIVLDVQGEKALLLSKAGLEVGPYNQAAEEVTWENCTLREWLNSGFLKTAFTEEEQSAIIKTAISNRANPKISGEGVLGGGVTVDTIFLLSYEEVMQFFVSDQARVCEATEYALSQGAMHNGGEKAVYWWLRSPGISQRKAAYVNVSGTCRGDLKGNNFDNNVNRDSFCIRPAIWLNLESF